VRLALHVASSADDDGGGVLSFDVDPGSGALRPAGERLGVPRILALALHPSRGVLYAASETGSIFALGRSVQPSGGTVPCSLAVAPGATHLLTANYGSGSVAVHPLASDGGIAAISDLVEYEGSGPVADRQEASHPHEVLFDASGNLLVSDLGADRIHVHRLDEARGRLDCLGSCEAPPGSGPRHLALAGDDLVLAADELSSTVSWYRGLAWQGRVPASELSCGEVNYPSEIALGRSGRFAYVGNRGHGTIGVLAVRAGGLEHVADVECGRWPQHLAILGDTLYVAAQEDDAVLAFALGPDGVPRERRQVAEVRSPSWILAA
jgi:6-phosphogluconolactonase